jgi:hypothetical protein
MNDLLECGHPPSAHSATQCTGYSTHDVNGKPFRRCYDCSAAGERRHMIDTGTATLYLVSKTPSPSEWHITDWPGVLDFPAFNMTHSEGRGFGGKYPIVTGRFIGPDGKLWAFRNAGDMQIARCKRLKDAR